MQLKPLRNKSQDRCCTGSLILIPDKLFLGAGALTKDVDEAGQLLFSPRFPLPGELAEYLDEPDE